jgi:lipopolysaccharide transport system permease protein
MKHPIFSYLAPWRHAGLIRQFTVREIETRYRQSWLGMLWAVLTPLLMLGIYTLVFRHIFKLRWGGADETNLTFALRLYAALAVFNFFSECIVRAPRLVLDQPHLVKKVVFPLEILPWISTLAALVHLGIAALVLLVFTAASNESLSASVLALPLVWLPLLPLCVGLGWILSAVGTYVRDISQLTGLAMSLLLFLSPVFFPVEALPPEWRGWMFLNPLALTMTQTREVLLAGHWPDWTALATQLGACMLIAAAGALFFRAARKGFADVV